MNKWLVPNFLKRLDTFLLENYPTIWRTRIHFVLWYAIIAIPIFFVIGYFYPIPYTQPIVDPINPIEITNEIYYLIPLAICVIGILYWAYLQYQFPLQRGEPQKALLTLFVYAIGLYTIIAFTAPAFRMGTIVHTAYNWMEEEDIQYLKKNDFFLYGFVLLEEDSIYQERADTFFQRREALFKDIWKHEDTILQNRYNPAFLDAFYKRVVKQKLIYRSDLSDLSYLSGSDWSYLSGPSYRLYWLYRSYKSYRSYESYLSYRSDRLYRSDRSDYSYYFQKNTLPKLDTKRMLRYEILPSYDTIFIRKFISYAYEELDSIRLIQYGLDTTRWSPDRMILVPNHIYQMEDAVRSVQHARVYLKEGIFGHSLWSMLLFLPLILIVFAAAPYLSFRMVLGALVGGGIIGLVSETLLESFIKEEYTFNGYAYLALPMLSFIGLVLFALWRKRNDSVLFMFHLLMVGVASILFFAIFGDKSIFQENDYGEVPFISMSKPVNLAFFGAPIIGLAGLLLMAYLQAQPKSS